MKIRRILKLLIQPKILSRKLLNRIPEVFRNKLLSFPSEDSIREQLTRISERKGKKPLIVFPSPSCPWGYLFQRPQQIARTLAKQGFTVIYMVDTSYVHAPDWNVRGFIQIEERLYLYNDGRNGEYLKKHLNNERLLVWQYWPHQSKIIDNLFMIENTIRLYDCIDHLTTFDPYERIQVDFIASIEKADLILATSKEIQESVMLQNKTSILTPNGVNIDDFKDITLADWPLLLDIKRSHNKIIGYYGAIASWFDFDLVVHAAKANPKWAFVIVGEVYSEVSQHVKKAQQQPNVIFIQRVSYEQIPLLLAYFDIAMLPFLINDITISTSPVKIFEYMAGGKVTVSTNLPEVRGYEAVLIANDKQQFQTRLLEAERMTEDPKLTGRIRENAAAHTWENRVNGVLLKLQEIGCESGYE